MHFQNDLFIRAARGEQLPRPPIWLMRQAGRTDPQYLAYRENAGLPLEKLFRHPEHAANITLQPKRLGVDALIVFQDILTPLWPMGGQFYFRPGPQLDPPLESPRDLERLQPFDVEQELSFVGEVFDGVYAQVGNELPVLGFAGAPFTLAVFLIEGKSFGEAMPRTLQFIEEDPEAVHGLLARLADMTIDYLRYQIRHGAAAVQLFESAAFLMPPELYHDYALPYQQRIFDALRGAAPTIMFARGWEDLSSLDAAGADIISLPETISISAAREALGQERVFQGNVDNQLLARGGREEIVQAAHACIEDGERRGHIFNLNHGLLRETPYENVQLLVETGRSA